MTLALLVAAWLVAVTRSPPRSLRRPSPNAVVDLCALLTLAVDGGMSLHGALRWSTSFSDSSLRPGLLQVLRSAGSLGLARALRGAEGPAGTLLRSLARPVDTGAALGPVLVGMRDRLEAEHLGEVEARLQRLPVRLVLPLALLMLPGLLLMIVAPVLINALSRLG